MEDICVCRIILVLQFGFLDCIFNNYTKLFNEIHSMSPNKGLEQSSRWHVLGLLNLWWFLLEHLKDRLANYIERFDGKVRLIRNAERQGLIRTRSRGATEARGEVIVFLDAHCEVNANWLPPLLAPIYYDRYSYIFTKT